MSCRESKRERARGRQRQHQIEREIVRERGIKGESARGELRKRGSKITHSKSEKPKTDRNKRAKYNE